MWVFVVCCGVRKEGRGEEGGEVTWCWWSGGMGGL
jgi:hypothetical protein